LQSTVYGRRSFDAQAIRGEQREVHGGLNGAFFTNAENDCRPAVESEA
jgi:hypothetical protein